LRDGVFIGGREFGLGRFAVVNAGDDAVGGGGEVVGELIVCGGVVDDLCARRERCELSGCGG
jgi:hypothetical protein